MTRKRPHLNQNSAFFQLKKLVFKAETWWLIAFSVMPWIGGSSLVFWGLENKAWLLSLSGIGFFGVFALLSLPIAFSLIPNTLAGLLAGFLFGIWALPGMVFSFTLASIWGFFIGKYLDSGLKETLFSIWPSWQKGYNKLKGQSFFIVFSFRLLPVPPFAIGNLLLAWLKIPLITYAGASFLGMLPRMTLVVWLGSQIKDLIHAIQHPGALKELTWFSWIALVLVFFLWRWIWRKVSVKDK